MLHAFADFVVGEGVTMDDVFANGAVGETIDAMVHEVKNDRPLAILDRVNVIARGTIETVPAAVVTADQSGRIHRGGYAFTARLHGELVVDQEVGVTRIADLHETAVVEFLF